MHAIIGRSTAPGDVSIIDPRLDQGHVRQTARRSTRPSSRSGDTNRRRRDPDRAGEVGAGGRGRADQGHRGACAPASAADGESRRPRARRRARWPRRIPAAGRAPRAGRGARPTRPRRSDPTDRSAHRRSASSGPPDVQPSRRRHRTFAPRLDRRRTFAPPAPRRRRSRLRRPPDVRPARAADVRARRRRRTFAPVSPPPPARFRPPPGLPGGAPIYGTAMRPPVGFHGDGRVDAMTTPVPGRSRSPR